MRHLFVTLVVLGFAISASTQTIVTGKVTDFSSDEPIAGANVLIKNTAGRLLAYGSTNAEGCFSINLTQSSDSLSLHVTMMGYKPYSRLIKSDGNTLFIKLEQSSVLLQEVTVKSDRIRENGDTITYNVSGFAQKQDKNIGDVLKRMPGIDVASNGKIQYQGIDINKLYIENNDLLGGKYGIATNGISHDDIGAVEVMENHQPMQVLRGLSFSDRAAINLKLKNRAKVTLLVHGTAGGWWSQQPKGGLWNGDIFTMMVTGKYQMITTFKGNNNGLNLSDQLLDFTSEEPDEKMEGYVSLSIPSTPDLQRNRSYFNRSWMVSSSHLLKTKNNAEFKAQIDYYNDRVRRQSESSTTYFLDAGNKIILEDQNSLAHMDAVTGKFSYEINEKTYFLSNTVSTDFSWNDLALNTTGSVPNTQITRMPEYSVNNRLKVIKRFRNNKLVTFTSRNEWNSLPERLIVTNDGKDYGQRIRQHSLYTDERASLGFVFNRILLSLEAGVSGYFRKLDTGLWGIDISDLRTGEELTTDYFRIFASPGLEWSYKRMDLTLNLPANIYSYFFSAGLRNRTEIFLSPSIAMRFHISPRMSFTLRGSARRSPASLHDIHPASILTDYRSFSSGVDDYYASSGHSISGSYSFRQAQKGIFITVIGSYGWNKSKFGSVQNIIGDYIFHSYTSRPADSHNTMTVFNVSKLLDFMRGAIGIKGRFNQTGNNIMSQGVQTAYSTSSFSLSPFVNGNISTFLNWNLRVTWDRSTLKISDIPTQRADGFIYSGSVTLTPCSLITWTTGGEFYRNEIEDGRYKKMLMLDTKLTFNMSKRIELSVTATNLFNKKEYGYTTYGTVSKCERSTLLRGREFMVSIYFKR